MAQKEITIRVSSPLLFIDEDVPSPDMSLQESFQSLTIVKRRGTSSERVENKTEQIERESGKPAGSQQQFELTIRGENTIINIQTIGKTPGRDNLRSNKEVYDFISDKVQEIFQSPAKDEIERALEKVSDGSKARVFTKKGAWKMLSRSARERERDQEERYPSMVLLQDPDPEPDSLLDKPKFDYRSKSMLSLKENFNELNMEKHAIDVHRSLVEDERRNLERQRLGLERGKTELEKNKSLLERSKSFLIQDKNILSEKRQVLNEEKATKNLDTAAEQNFQRKEKLCFELEKQLLEDEKKIICDEQNILGKEKEFIAKEKSILGGEKTVLEEEMAILGKEKSVFEKQHSFLSETLCKPEELRDSYHQSDEGLSEIEDVFQEAYHLGRTCSHFRPPRPERPTPTFQPFCGNTYPMYVPVYSLPRPQYPYPSCHKNKSIQTQTEKEESALEDATLPGLPFGLLSGMFPRVVITSMPTYQHGAEERADLARGSKITEIREEVPVKPPTPKPEASKPKKKPIKKVTKPVASRSSHPSTLKSLKPPGSDLSLKAKSVKSKPQTDGVKTTESVKAEDVETDDSGLQTIPTESIAKDDVSGVSDETICYETIHFGYSDDFYSNDAIFPGNETLEEKGPTKKLPLTNIGYEMFEKLTQFTPERDGNRERGDKEKPIDNKLSDSSDINVNLHINEGRVELSLPGNMALTLTQQSQDSFISGAEKCAWEDSGKVIVKKSDLWHTDEPIWNKEKEKVTNSIHLTFPTNQSGTSPSAERPGPTTNINLFIAGCKESKICTCEAKVGTDDRIAGGELRMRQYGQATGSCDQLSPRAADLLDALRRKLVFAESEKKVIAYGRQSPVVPETARMDTTFSRSKKKTQEYLCEECLATMRMYEDVQTVQNIVDKFENLSRRK